MCVSVTHDTSVRDPNGETANVWLLRRLCAPTTFNYPVDNGLDIDKCMYAHWIRGLAARTRSSTVSNARLSSATSSRQRRKLHVWQHDRWRLELIRRLQRTATTRVVPRLELLPERRDDALHRLLALLDLARPQLLALLSLLNQRERSQIQEHEDRNDGVEDGRHRR